jgi:hypothetical protein
MGDGVFLSPCSDHLESGSMAHKKTKSTLDNATNWRDPGVTGSHRSTPLLSPFSGQAVFLVAEIGVIIGKEL